jgi:hypothetical protein
MHHRHLGSLLVAAALAACANPQPCPQPLHQCNGQCIDIQSNQSHCGGCGSACRVNEICRAGACTAATQAACPERIGGGFVTFGSCGQTVKLWFGRVDLISEAASYVGSTTPSRLAVLGVIAGSDCDAQWTWHVNDATAVFSATPPAGCAACPSDIQLDMAGHPTWCPATVLASDPVP